MPSLSSVIKSEKVKMKGSSLRLPLRYAVNEQENDGTEAGAHTTHAPQPLLDAEARAAQIVAAAEQEVNNILATAQEEKENLLRQAQQVAEQEEQQAKMSGYDAGYQEGLSAGQEVAACLQQEARQLLAEARQVRAEMLERVEPQVVALAVSIAEKLVAQQLAAQPETVLSLVRELLRHVKDSGEIFIRLHPADVELCRDKMPQLQAEVREHSTVSLLPDASLERGNCRIESDKAVIECLLGERFDKLRELLTDVNADE